MRHAYPVGFYLCLYPRVPAGQAHARRYTGSGMGRADFSMNLHRHGKAHIRPARASGRRHIRPDIRRMDPARLNQNRVSHGLTGSCGSRIACGGPLRPNDVNDAVLMGAEIFIEVHALQDATVTL